MIVIIEAPKGSRKKSEIKANGNIKTKYKTRKGFVANYGKIPYTVAGDGDNIDAFVLGKRLRQGKTVNAEVLYMFERVQDGQEDNKVVAYCGQYTKCKARQAKRLEKHLKSEIIGKVGHWCTMQYLKENSVEEIIKAKNNVEIM